MEDPILTPHFTGNYSILTGRSGLAPPTTNCKMNPKNAYCLFILLLNPSILIPELRIGTKSVGLNQDAVKMVNPNSSFFLRKLNKCLEI